MRYLALLAALAAGCSSSDDPPPDPTGGSSTPTCEPSFDGDTLHFALGTELEPGADETLCLRWTTDEAIDISGFVGELGALGHHSLLMVQESPNEPDGIAPCYEPELMDVAQTGDFAMLVGVSYESSGVPYDFPSTPVQVGLHVDAGSQLIFDAHFLNTGGSTREDCSTLDLERGAPVVARLEFRTVLPEEQYTLSVPAMGSIDVEYTQPIGERVRVAAASSHMHEGGTHFRMSVLETDKTLFETDVWAEPRPALYPVEKIVLEPEQSFRLECSFDNPNPGEMRFPQQMCVGGLYVLSCDLPGAC